jgi:hypothetical protein
MNADQGDITLDGMKLSGTLASTLAPHPMVSIALQAQQTLRLDRWLPEPPLSGAAHFLRGRTARAASAGEPAWLAALRSLNGDLSLPAPAHAWGPYKMTGFALSARLKDGRLAVERFAGSLGGATVQLSGSVDAQQVPAALSVDGKLLDIDVSRVIAVAHTKNDFGTDDLAVALHGKISLAGMALRARGTILDDALQSLSGKARTTGEIRPVITRGSLSLASLATGIGSLFSSEMGFASAILENFIDRQVSARGALEVGDGIVYLRDYLLEGEKAKAVIHGHVAPPEQGHRHTDRVEQQGRLDRLLDVIARSLACPKATERAPRRPLGPLLGGPHIRSSQSPSPPHPKMDIAFPASYADHSEAP